MKSLLLAAGLVSAGVLSAAPAGAQSGAQAGTQAGKVEGNFEGKAEARQETKPEAGPQHPGHILVLSKCFQCHTDAMYRDQRQDRRSWEATVYRMVGRGALWTPEEIRLMADYLGTEYGPNKSAASPH